MTALDLMADDRQVVRAQRRRIADLLPAIVDEERKQDVCRIVRQLFALEILPETDWELARAAAAEQLETLASVSDERIAAECLAIARSLDPHDDVFVEKNEDVRSDKFEPVQRRKPNDDVLAQPPMLGANAFESIRAIARELPLIRTEINEASPSNFYTGLSGDIARGGVFVAQQTELALGTPVMLQIELPDDTLRAEGRVVWLDRDEEIGTGVQFRNLSDHAELSVLRFVGRREPRFQP
ncbi:MAG: PilZ domain-containing protein [Polyangiales bacterium]